MTPDIFAPSLYARVRLPEMEAETLPPWCYTSPEFHKREVERIFDVFDPEPLPPGSPLWKTPNLILTPHVSSDDAQGYAGRTLDLVFENVRRYLAGRPLKNRVRPDREY